jgi:hypothetical protein
MLNLRLRMPRFLNLNLEKNVPLSHELLSGSLQKLKTENFEVKAEIMKLKRS